MSNAKQLKTVPVAEFPVELINSLIEKYNLHKDNVSLFLGSGQILSSTIERAHLQTIREVLAVFNINPDEQ